MRSKNRYDYYDNNSKREEFREKRKGKGGRTQDTAQDGISIKYSQIRSECITMWLFTYVCMYFLVNFM